MPHDSVKKNSATELGRGPAFDPVMAYQFHRDHGMTDRNWIPKSPREWRCWVRARGDRDAYQKALIWARPRRRVCQPQESEVQRLTRIARVEHGADWWLFAPDTTTTREFEPDPPSIEDWSEHPDRDLLMLLGAAERPGSDGRPVTLGDVLAMPDPKWLVGELLIENELAVLYGRPKTFKTFTAIDLALSVATGRDFHGLKVGPPMPVVYVIAEGNAKLFALRCQAWLAKRGIGRPPANFRMLPARIAMNDPAAVRDLIRSIGRPALVVIDTLTRTLNGDENSPADIARFISGCDDLRDSTGAAVLVIHHEGKTQDRGPMGHTRILAAVDTSIRMRTESNGTIKLTVEDQRNGPGDLEMLFRIGDGPCLEAIITRHDETDAEFLDFRDDASADRLTRVRRLAATMAGRQKGEVIDAVAKMLGVSDQPGRKALADAVPTGFDHAVEFEGKRLWLERISGRSTMMKVEPVQG